MHSHDFSLSYLKLFQFYRQHQGPRNRFQMARAHPPPAIKELYHLFPFLIYI